MNKRIVELIKFTIIHTILLQIYFIQKLLGIFNYKYFLKGEFFNKFLVQTTDVAIKSGTITFHTPNSVTRSRAELIFDKEPETIEWINNFEQNCIFWDIGANVGIYSIYAASEINGANVIAFEPSIENYYLLNRNISENNLSKRVLCLPFALSDSSGAQDFQHLNIEFGGSINSFGVNYSHDGLPAEFIFQYRVLGLRADDLPKLFGIPKPNHLKIDVDGIEHLIAKGAEATLSNSTLKSVMIELNLNFSEQHETVSQIFSRSGLKLAEVYTPNLSGPPSTAQTFNHLFIR